MSQPMLPPQHPVRPLPVFKAFAHMLASLSGHWQKAVRVALPWLALLTLLNIWSLKSQPLTPPTPTEINLSVLDIVALVFGLLATSSIAVSWHRFILLDAPLASEPYFRLDKVVWRYIGRSLIIYGLCLVPMMPLFMIGGMIVMPAVFALVILALFFQLVVFVCRISLCLPALAIGNAAIGIRQAAEATRGNNLRILGLLSLSFIVLATVFLVYLSVIGVINAAMPNMAMPIALVMAIPMQFFSVLLNTTLLTSLYGFFVEHRDF